MSDFKDNDPYKSEVDYTALEEVPSMGLLKHFHTYLRANTEQSQPTMSDFKDTDPYKSEVDYTALEAVPLMGGAPPPAAASSSSFTNFPGNRRIPLASFTSSGSRGPPPNNVFVKTAGNALQAVPQTVVEQQDRLVAVSVPENVPPGSTIYVQYGNNNESLLQATIPAGALPGHTFFVQVPDTKEDPVVAVTGVAVSNTTLVVSGHEAAGDLFLHEQSKDQAHDKV